MLYQDMSDHPVQLAQLWRRENAKCIHVTDTDSFSGRESAESLDTVISMQRAVDIPIEFVTLQRDVQVLRRLLDAGIYRIAVNALLQTDPDAVQKLIEDYGSSRVAFSVRAHAGVVEMDNGETMADVEMIRLVHSLGGKRVIYSEKDWEGALSGEDITLVERVAAAAPVRLTMAGGIASPQHLWDLQERAPANVDSVVIGRALYENRFPCQLIWRSVEARLEPHSPGHLENGKQSSISRL
jgi:phosphoribosylformimino-5-aminoimidazole carboxamide ribotide isomerase